MYIIMLFNIIYEFMVKSPYDEYGCCISCGYTWCEALQQCIRVWETYCESLDVSNNQNYGGH